ncbi:hypothetical protein [Rhizobium sp. BG4]|uniref:hypothetical protein n=1 Tax=Rhizobium sp. BG4 TaxID=2613770 RepID=UPI00193D9291|nr:hypothetical protein [Rhizobium sp. BG4]
MELTAGTGRFRYVYLSASPRKASGRRAKRNADGDADCGIFEEDRSGCRPDGGADCYSKRHASRDRPEGE